MERGLIVERTAQKIGVYVQNRGIVRGIPRGKVIRSGKIYAGDRVEGIMLPDGNFAIERVLERKNILVRPPLANADRAICVMTIKDPDFDNHLLDSLLVVYEHVGASPAIVFNKIDLLDQDELRELGRWEAIYKEAGYDTVRMSADSGIGLENFRKLVRGSIIFLAGPSGTGKSSILKALTGEELKTGEVSRKLGRGRHTTTGVRLLPFGDSSFIADTPGFSKVDVLEFVRKRDVRLYFREFLFFECRYPDCTHTEEPHCGVTEAVANGQISCERYKSYLKMVRSFKEDLREICR